MEKETYNIAVHCTNCDWSTFSECYAIPKGVETRSYLRLRKCNKCGCNTLAKGFGSDTVYLGSDSKDKPNIT